MANFVPYYKKCEWCGKEFMVENPQQTRKRYCSIKCRGDRAQKQLREDRKHQYLKSDKVEIKSNLPKVELGIEEVVKISSDKGLSYGDVTQLYYSVNNVREPYNFGKKEKIYKNVNFTWKSSK